MFEYLRDVIYNPEKAHMDPDTLSPDFRMFGKGLVFYAHSAIEANALAADLARGHLSSSVPSPANEMAAPLKALHASLRHLTWQAQQVAQGDYSQRVDFMGEFSDAFNMMIEQLDARQQALLAEIESGHIKTQALEQSNALMSVISHNSPQAIVVFKEETNEKLFQNKACDEEEHSDPRFIGELYTAIEQNEERISQNERVEYSYLAKGAIRSIALVSYPIVWGAAKARTYIVSDISAEKQLIHQLEEDAYRDKMTNLYNRNYGMRMLNKWVEEGREFVLSFVDLNNLKYVNDTAGHPEGDRYIYCVAKNLQEAFEHDIVSRVGGDEFFVLAAKISVKEADERMRRTARKISQDEYLAGKKYSYSISYGAVEAIPGMGQTASEILRLADDRMYEHKRLNRKAIPRTPL